MSLSHTMRVRGLKLSINLYLTLNALSHPMRVRGLKPTNVTDATTGYVAPHAGAWIETWRVVYAMSGISSHPMRVRGLKQGRPVYS